jgi:hypothetical protein
VTLLAFLGHVFPVLGLNGALCVFISYGDVSSIDACFDPDTATQYNTTLQGLLFNSLRAPWWTAFAICVSVAEVVLFLAMSGWVTHKRRHDLAACTHQYGGAANIPPDAMRTVAKKMGVPMSVPGLSYKFDAKTLCTKAPPPKAPEP